MGDERTSTESEWNGSFEVSDDESKVEAKVKKRNELFALKILGDAFLFMSNSKCSAPMHNLHTNCALLDLMRYEKQMGNSARTFIVCISKPKEKKNS